MDFTINTKKFKDTLNKVTTILGVEEMKLNNYIKLETHNNIVNLQANNHEGGISVNIEADIQNNGNATVAAKLINTLVSKIEAETIHIKTEQNKLIITSDNIKAELKTTDSISFTEYPEPQNTQKIIMDRTELSKALTSSSTFCNEKATNGLQGVHIKVSEEQTTITGFSSSMGTVYEIKNKNSENNNASFIISKKCASILESLCQTTKEENITLNVTDSLLFYKDENTTFTSRLICAKYPDVKRIFKQNKAAQQTVEKDKFIKALERISCFISPESLNPVILKTKDNILKLNISSEIGQHTEELSFKGAYTDTIIALNCTYLMKILKKADSDKINLYINGSLQPAFITTDNAQFVISPVRTIQTETANKPENTQEKEAA